MNNSGPPLSQSKNTHPFQRHQEDGVFSPGDYAECMLVMLRTTIYSLEQQHFARWSKASRQALLVDFLSERTERIAQRTAHADSDSNFCTALPRLIPALYCRSQRQVAVCSYQNGSQPFGNTASGSNRAALTETIDAPIDISREVVTTQTVPLPGVRKSYRVSYFGEMPLVHCTNP